MVSNSAALFYAEKHAWEGLKPVPLTIEACQTAVNFFTCMHEVVETFGTKHIRVSPLPRRKYRLGMLGLATRDPDQVYLNNRPGRYDGRRLDVLVHEMTHVYDIQVWVNDAAHNEAFATNLLTMTEITIGTAHADALRIQYRKYDVAYKE